MLLPPRALRSLTAAALAATLSLAGCSTPSATIPSEASPPASAPSGDVARGPASVAPSAAPAGASASPSPTASLPPEAAAPSEEPAPPTAPSAAPAEPPPNVKIANIGMHIGGGPNDGPTKEPIKLSVEPHFDAFRRCFALVEDPKKGGDFGVDLRIEKDGGKAKVTKPRTALKGEGFTRCMVGVFEAIDFRKPKGGATVVSYSLKFSP